MVGGGPRLFEGRGAADCDGRALIARGCRTAPAAPVGDARLPAKRLCATKPLCFGASGTALSNPAPSSTQPRRACSPTLPQAAAGDMLASASVLGGSALQLRPCSRAGSRRAQGRSARLAPRAVAEPRVAAVPFMSDADHLKKWSRESWRNYPALQQPAYPDPVRRRSTRTGAAAAAACHCSHACALRAASGRVCGAASHGDGGQAPHHRHLSGEAGGPCPGCRPSSPFLRQPPGPIRPPACPPPAAASPAAPPAARPAPNRRR